MARQPKEIIEKEKSFDLLDIRLGQIKKVEKIDIEDKKAYKLTIDFGKFGIKTSIGRFTNHSIEEILNKLVLGILNFEERIINGIKSEVLILGVQYPKANSNEATFISPMANAKIGSKVF